MLLKDLGMALEKNSLGILGTSIFLGDMPDEAPDACIGLFEYPGSPASLTSTGVAVERPRVQILVRDVDYYSARQRAEQIYQLLNATGEFHLNGTKYLWIEALSPPFFLSRDTADRVKIGCNYMVVKELTKREE